MFNRKVLILTLAGVVGVVLIGAAVASTASNTVSTSKAGEGAGAISGYNISSVHYNLNSTDPSNIDSVAFTLDAAPAAGSTVRVQLSAAGTTWYTCTFTSTATTCPTTSPQATIGASDSLKVVVAQ